MKLSGKLLNWSVDLFRCEFLSITKIFMNHESIFTVSLCSHASFCLSILMMMSGVSPLFSRLWMVYHHVLELLRWYPEFLLYWFPVKSKCKQHLRRHIHHTVRQPAISVLDQPKTKNAIETSIFSLANKPGFRNVITLY